MKDIPSKVLKILSSFFTSQENVEIKSIYGGGSQRRYYRITGEEKNYILCHSDNIDEVKDHIDISMFFEKYSVPVPKIYKYIQDDGIILFEDIGNMSLQKKIKNNDNELLNTYKNTIDLLIKLQKLNPLECKAIEKRSFNKDYYRWETNYFLENCIEKLFNINGKNNIKLINEFDELAEELSKEKKVIVHRDFQSQNIYINKENIYFLDFQGARQGARQYDLASLIFDPYINMSGSKREILLNYYYEEGLKEQIIEESKEIFTDIFYKVSLQRLMQAMGAYGFLGLIKGKKEFLKYVAPGKKLLKEASDNLKNYNEIKKLLNTINDIEGNKDERS